MADYNENDYFKILTHSISVGSQFTFDGYILLKKTGRIIHFAHIGEKATQEMVDKLRTGQVDELYVKKEQKNEYTKYLAQFFQSDEGQQYLEQTGKSVEDFAVKEEITVGENYEDLLTSYDGWDSIPVIIQEIFKYSADFRFYVKSNSMFDEITESSVQKCYNKIGELFKALLIENQIEEKGDAKIKRMMDLCQKQMNYIAKLESEREQLVFKVNKAIENQQRAPTIQVKDDDVYNYIAETDDYIKRLEHETSSQQDMIDDLRYKVENLQDLYQKAEFEKDNLFKEISSKKQEITDIKDLLNDSRSKVASRDQEIKNLSGKLQDRGSDCASELNSKQNQLIKLENELQTKQDTIKSLLSDIEKLKSNAHNVTSLKKQLSEKIDKFNEVKITYTKTQDNLNGKITALKNLNDQANKTIKHLTKSNQDLKKKAA